MTTAALGNQLPLWSVAPFVSLLVLVAALELAAQRWWASLVNKLLVAAALAVPAALHLVVGHGSGGGPPCGIR